MVAELNNQVSQNKFVYYYRIENFCLFFLRSLILTEILVQRQDIVELAVCEVPLKSPNYFPSSEDSLLFRYFNAPKCFLKLHIIYD